MVSELQARYLGFLGLEAEALATVTQAIIHFGSLAGLLEASDADLWAARLDPIRVRRLLPDRKQLSGGDRILLEQTADWLEQSPRHHLVCLESPFYPSLLPEIHAPPAMLFVAGDPALLRQPQLAVVGSRKASHAGMQTAFWLGTEIGRLGLSLCSGLALGIDAAAHRGALAADSPTIAVVGTGLDEVYPASNRKLAEAIASGGALVSEFPLGSPPRRDHFPRRNRIISGISLATIVVEATRNSGSLITARLALEQGREVFAVPGSIHDGRSQGCHWLIKQGAKLLDSISDLREEIPQLAHLATAADQRPTSGPGDGLQCALPPPRTHTEEAVILAGLEDSDVTLDLLSARLGIPADRLDRILSRLELGGVVERQSGRIRRANTGLRNQGE